MRAVVLAELAALAASGVAIAAVAVRARVPRLAVGVLTGLGAAAGIALLAALSSSEWTLGLTLVPLTALSVVTFTRTVLTRVAGWRGWAATALLLFLGAALLLSQTPRPLTRSVLAGPEAVPIQTIQPGASRPVRG